MEKQGRIHKPFQQKFGDPASRDPEENTTIMIRNVPRSYTEEALLAEIASYISRDSYNFMYLPWDARRRSNMGYAFLNLIDAETARHACELLEGLTWRLVKSTRVVHVVYAHLQGLAANIAQYIGTAVVEEGHGHAPVIFENGNQVPFRKAVERYCPEALVNERMKELAEQRNQQMMSGEPISATGSQEDSREPFNVQPSTPPLARPAPQTQSCPMATSQADAHAPAWRALRWVEQHADAGHGARSPFGCYDRKSFDMDFCGGGHGCPSVSASTQCTEQSVLTVHTSVSPSLNPSPTTSFDNITTSSRRCGSSTTSFDTINASSWRSMAMPMSQTAQQVPVMRSGLDSPCGSNDGKLCDEFTFTGGPNVYRNEFHKDGFKGHCGPIAAPPARHKTDGSADLVRRTAEYSQAWSRLNYQLEALTGGYQAGTPWTSPLAYM